MSGTSKNTVLKLLAEVGEACALYQDRVMVGLSCKKIQCDEIWSFVGMKEKNVPAEVKGVFGIGDVYTWTSIDADKKLMPCWHVGTRGAISASISCVTSRRALRTAYSSPRTATRCTSMPLKMLSAATLIMQC
jgi:hypothetical protein